MKKRHDALGELAAMASPGPWHVTADKLAVWSGEHGRICRPPNHSKIWTWEENSEFIAAARNEVPGLIEDVRALEAALRGLYDAVDSGVELTPDVMRAAQAALIRVEDQ